MKSLLLSGYNIHLHVMDEKLIVMDGRGWNKQPTEMIFTLNFIDYDNIIIYGHSGNIALSAIDWLMRNKVSINIMNNDGSFLTSINPPQLKFGHVRMAQYKAHQYNRIEIGKKFIEAKIKGTETVMRWLDDRYSEIRPHIKKMDFSKMQDDLKSANNDKDVLRIEGNLSGKYWTALREIFQDKLDLDIKGSGSANSPKDTIDPIRSLFTYGYSVLESVSLRAINGANLDPYIGFLHRIKLARSPLVEDFKEPYEWLVDKTIIQAIENELFKRYDFIREEDSTLRLRPDGVKRLIGELDKTFTQPIKYKGRNHQWYVLIQIKAQELSHYLTNNRKNIDFCTPEPYIEKPDSKKLREKILKISYSDWKNMGYSHGSLHYLKKCAKSSKPFKITKQSAEKLDTMNIKQ